MKPVSPDVSFPKLEESILGFWSENKIFQKSMESELPVPIGTPGKPKSSEKTLRKPYIFYDGPPFATGLPHYGHLLAGTIKDVVGRFFTMKGHQVDRRFGWDCHGVPVEFEIQKTLNLHGIKAIKEFGVGKFNEECRKIVLRYTHEWRRFVERSGRWVDFEREYKTMDLDFMESIWWVVKRLWDRGLIYKGTKCVPYSWAINTPLSNFEANLNYKTVQDPAVTVRVKLRGDLGKKLGVTLPAFPVNAYIWTTTPWTLPSNMGLAVGTELQYSLIVNPAHAEVVIVASDLRKTIFPKLVEEACRESADGSPYLVGEVSGRQLLGIEYDTLFPYFESERAKNAFRIFSGDFVTATDGTGIVHLASFGEDDLRVFQENGISIVDPVDDDGNFTEAVKDFAGQNVKAADSKIILWLKERERLVSHKTIEHSYPFCWRTDTPLIYKSIATWFVRVEEIRDELVQMNSIVHWVPEHLRDGRMGNWLEGARDWAISRNRFWGTPLPIWSCNACDHLVCIGSVEELEKLTGEKATDLHSHFIDQLKAPCPQCSGTLSRVPEVLDCWFESGSMPYAQAHYPFEGKEKFERNFPADFIAEGLDQTRGWFYTLLVLSTALFGRPAFRNVIVNGIVLAEDGKKMSKSLKNYPPPDAVMNEVGADALRLYLLSSAATRADDLRFSKAGVQQVVRQTLLPLWNAYNFFVTYALVDDWNPTRAPKTASENLLDKWILSKVGSLVAGVDSALSSYHLSAAIQPILEFVDQLTNWYIRLNRRRFWAGNTGEHADDKLHAYATLHRVLVSFVRVLGPLAPFISEEIYQNLKDGIPELSYESVHLAPFPTLDEFKDIEINHDLEMAMELFEEAIVLGRMVRNDNGLKVRQPLSKITVIHPSERVLKNIKLFEPYICEELNIKSVEYTSDEEKYVSLKAQLNTKALGSVLGPRLGSEGMKKLRVAAENLSSEQIWSLEDGESLSIEGVDLKLEDFVIKRSTKAGVKASASSGQVTIVLETNLTQELKLEGLAREFVNRVQKLRKDLHFDVSDRILVTYMTACPLLLAALKEYESYIVQEILAVEMLEAKKESEIPQSSQCSPEAQEIGGKAIIIALRRVQA